MNYKMVAIGVLVLGFLAILYRGDRNLKARNRAAEQVENSYGSLIEIFDNVVYQGGFPPMPKPARLNLGITESELILFDKAGNNGGIPYDSIRKLDRFTTKNVRKHKFGLMAYGPLALILNNPTFRHFLVVEYIDVNAEKNNMVVMLKTRELSEKLHDTLKPYIKKKRK
jgi:hypothetical protein